MDYLKRVKATHQNGGGYGSTGYVTKTTSNHDN